MSGAWGKLYSSSLKLMWPMPFHLVEKLREDGFPSDSDGGRSDNGAVRESYVGKKIMTSQKSR